MSKTADQALYEVLAAFSGLQELLGGATDPRIYPIEAPESAPLPLLVYQVIVTNPVGTHGQGLSDDESRLDEVNFQLTALAETQLQAAAILYQARLAIEASATLRGLQTDERTLARAEEAQAHGRSADFRIWNDPDSSA